MFISSLGVLDMHQWLKVSAGMAVLLAGAGASYRLVLPGIEPAPLHGEYSPVQRGRALEECLQAAQMVYAVHWAVACMSQAGQAPAGTNDGNAECDLPDSKAAVVNAWLDKAEKACRTEVHAGVDP